MTEQEQNITQCITTFFIETFGVCPRKIRTLALSIVSLQKSKNQREQIISLIKSHGNVDALKHRIDKIQLELDKQRLYEATKTL